MLTDLAWYVLLTRTRYENTVCEGLIRKSFDVFLPTISVPSKRRDRSVILHPPLFPNYLFVKTSLDPDMHIEMLKTIGVVRLIGGADGPIPVPDESIDSLRIMTSNTGDITIGKNLKPGDPVIVVDGPFSGIRGFFKRYRGKNRVIVQIDALGQFAAVEVNEFDIERL
jgi:transcription antitermination factor NusG